MKRSADPNSDKMRAEFRQKLENYQSAPTHNLWDKIELSLDKEEALVYKNRFRTYSRLAAACLLLLLAFSAVFIPNKLKQIQTETAGTSTQNTTPNTTEAVASSPLNRTKKTAENSQVSHGTAAEKGRIPAQKSIAPAAAVRNAEAALQPALNPQNVAAVNAQKLVSGKKPEKTVAFSAPKVKPQTQISGTTVAKNAVENAAEVLQNAMLSAAKTAKPPSSFVENSATVEPEDMAANAKIASASESEQPAEINASTPVMAARKTSQEVNKATIEAISEKQEKEIAAAFSNKNATDLPLAIGKTNIHAPQSYSLVLKKAPFKPLPYLKTGTSQPQTGQPEKPLLPDSTMLATLPEIQENTQTEKAVTEVRKTSKWLLALGYSGQHFKPGMQLTSQAKATPNSGSLTSNLQQTKNIQQYETAIREFNQDTRSAYSQKAALQIAYKFSENWLVQSGFMYSRNRAYTNSHYAFTEQSFGNTGTVSQQQQQTKPNTTLQTVLESSFDPMLTQTIQTPATKNSYRFEQLGMPLNLRYQTASKPVYYFASAGFSLHLLTATTIEAPNQQVTYSFDQAKADAAALHTSSSQNIFRKWLPAIGFQAGLGHYLSEHWQAELALEGEQYLKPLIQAETLAGTSQKNPVSVGASLKLGYRF